MITLPETVTTTDLDDDTVHVVCCDPDVGMCGAPLADDVWVDVDTETTCPLCAIAEEEELPCGDLKCPRWAL